MSTRARVALALVLGLALGLAGGCAAKPAPPFPSQLFSATGAGTPSEGVKVTGVNPSFDVTVYPTVVDLDKDKALRIEYNCDVTNASESSFADFTMTLELNPEVKPFLASGLVVVPFGPIELLGVNTKLTNPDSQGRGVKFSNAKLLNVGKELTEFAPGRSLREVLEHGGKYVIVLHWAGGEERIAVHSQVLDPAGLLK